MLDEMAFLNEDLSTDELFKKNKMLKEELNTKYVLIDGENHKHL